MVWVPISRHAQQGAGPDLGTPPPRFDVDESALPIGVDLFFNLVDRYLVAE